MKINRKRLIGTTISSRRKDPVFLKKGFIAFFTVILLSTLLMVTVEAATNNYTYDPDAALVYAKNHCERDKELHPKTRMNVGACSGGWLCAEFVANCIYQGGLTRIKPSQTRLASQFIKKVENEYKVEVINGNSKGGKLYQSNFNKPLEKGDVIVWKYGTASPTGHVVIYSGKTDELGRLLVYAHNGRQICETTSVSLKYKGIDWIKAIHFLGKNVSYDITAKATGTTNTSTKFEITFNPKAPVKNIQIFYGTDKNKIRKITEKTKKESGDGYDHKLLWRNESGNNISSYTFNTKNETANGWYIKLKPGTSYYYKICARMTNGRYYISDLFSFTTRADKPAPVTSLTFEPAGAKYAPGDQVTVNWKASGKATGYRVVLRNTKGEVSHQSCTGTTCKLAAPTSAGSYQVQVYAFNEAGDSKAAEKSLQVMAGVSLTFQYGENMPDETRAVKYNGTVTTPATPTRAGHTFLGWRSESGRLYGAGSTIKNIVKSETYTASWRVNKYKVKLLDGYNQSQIGSIVTLEYGTEFKASEFIETNGIVLPEHEGYQFAGFSEDVYTVTAEPDQAVYALYRWESLNKLTARITAIDRAREKTDLKISDGYSIDVEVEAPEITSGGSSEPIKGRVIVALKTGAGRLLIETESAAFVLYPKTTRVSKTINVFVPYESQPDKYPEQAEAFVVNNYYSAGIISNVAENRNLLLEANADEEKWILSTEQVEKGGHLSDGTEVMAVDHSRDEIVYNKKVTLYRTAFAKDDESYQWQSEVWKPFCSGKKQYVKSWPELGSGLGSGFNNNSGVGKTLYNKYNIQPVKAVAYSTRRVTSSEKVIGYIYYHWCRGLDTGDLEHAVKKTNRITGDGEYVYDKFEAFYSTTELPQGTYLDYTYYSAKNDSALRGKSKDSYFWFRRAVYEQNWQEEYKLTTWKKTETDSTVVAKGGETQPQGSRNVSAIEQTITSLADSGITHAFTKANAEMNVTTVIEYEERERRYAYRVPPETYPITHEDLNLQDAMTVDVGTGHAGETAVVYIYKDRQAADYTTEYIEAVTVDEDGMITIAGPSGGQLQTREDISSETGAFTVAVALYGESNARIIKTIEVPDEKKPLYKVVFLGEVESVDSDGFAQIETVTVETQEVREGHNAEYPDESLVPVKEGYHFTGWDESIKNVRGDMAVHAEYDRNEYSVVFVDWESRQVETEKRLHGDAVAAPALPEPPEGLDVHWVVLGDDSSVAMTLEEYEGSGNVVTGDMVVAAEYFTKKVDLTVVQFEEALSAENMTPEEQREILEETSEMDLGTINTAESVAKYPTKTESYEYADIIDLDAYEAEYDDGIVFVGWRNAANNSELLQTAEITDDMTIYPVYRFEETVETPEADIRTGEYDAAQTVTLSCGTENAVIYYTTDGSDPAELQTAKKYTEPILVEKSCTLRACAMALGMNNSETMEELYAVNTGDGIAYHIVTIYANIAGEDLEGYIFRERVRDGAKLDVSGLDNQEHYLYSGLYYDEEYKEEFLTESETVMETLDLYALYEPKEYRVSFEDEDGTVYSEQMVAYGNTAEMPENPEKEGQRFIAWEPDAGEPILGDTTFTALFVPEDEYVTVKLNRSRMASIVGASITLKATVEPEELTGITELLWESSDESVAEVDENGKVTFVGTGSAEITVMAVSTRETATCMAVVMKNPDSSITLARNSTLDMDAMGYIRRVKEDRNTVAALRNEFVNETLLFIGPDGGELEEESLVGTGTVVRLADGSTVLDEAAVVMTGDVDGDGRIRNRDASMAAEIAAGMADVEESRGLAADANGDGNVNEADSEIITRYLVGKAEMD